MICEPLSVSVCRGSSGECQKLIQQKASSPASPTRQGKDGWHFPYWEPCAVLVLLLVSACYYNEISFYQQSLDKPYNKLTAADYSEFGIAVCKTPPCFEPSSIHVALKTPGFPSFLDHAHRGPLLVSYDKRSLTLNGKRTFFLGGSMHPARATSQTWNQALDEAVENGLNLITIYVMWSDHQPLPDKAIDWTFPDWSLSRDAACHDTVGDKSCRDWNLASAIRSAANHGLFVHLRIGPYDCAEYSYGGIPEWLLLQKPKMKLRRPNREWLEGKSRNESITEGGAITIIFC